MSERLARFREILAPLAAADPSYRRFGAASHRYEMRPPVSGGDLAAIEHQLGVTLPDDYRAYITGVAVGGAGPGYGLLPATRTAAFVIDVAHADVRGRALPVAHLGCGYVAALLLDGPARGHIWCDARHVDVVVPMFPSFEGFIVDWVDCLANNRWPAAYVPAGRCALQAALSGYLHMCEQQLGVADGQLSGAQLADALAGLGPGAIAIAAESALFGERDNVDPCITCARVVESLAAQGLDPAVVLPGQAPLPARR